MEGHQKPMRRRRCRLRYRREIAYDLETSAITGGETPDPRYLALFDGDQATGVPVHGLMELGAAVIWHMLTDEHVGCRFIAFNGNRFDGILVALALLEYPGYRCEPWLARENTYRGMQVIDTANEKRRWFFSDPMAMFAFTGTLAAFLQTFAPEQVKQHIDVIHFDAANPAHVEYALNDARALWYASRAAGKAQTAATGIPPQNTIGKAAIKLFESRMPEGVLVWKAPQSMELSILKTKRGGYVHCAGRFRGLVWKYDLNQAYAWGMKQPLPSGRAVHTRTYWPSRCGIYLTTIGRDNPARIPFYIRNESTGYKEYVTGETSVTGWITSPEVDFLMRTGWHVTIHDGWYWTDSFTMTDLVDELERNRLTCEGGPKGPLGYFYKAMGNNAYGKTLERVTGIRVVAAKECPAGFVPLYGEDPAFDGLWVKQGDARQEPYHRPQLGSFITAYVRIRIMDTALLASDAFVYADTDCVVFSCPMDDVLWIDPGKYGAFKREEAGEPFLFINKKVYCSLATREDEQGRIVPVTAHAKGLHVRELTFADFERWYDGEPPRQAQTQRKNFLSVLSGDAMFYDSERSGSFTLPMAAD